jgi:hypothetical protein
VVHLAGVDEGAALAPSEVDARSRT